MFSWAGKILNINLTTGEIRETDFPLDMGVKFLGARGINAKLLWDLIRDPGLSPFSPEKPLIFGADT